ARWVKDPTRPRFVLSAVPVQMLGLAILIVGNLVWPHVWLWSVVGTCFYAFGIGLIFPTLFRFTLFSNDLPKGTVSASLNIVILSVSALSIEGARWLWFHGGRLPFHLLAVAAGIVAACCLARLLRHQRGQAVIEARQS
ncbi:TPA: MFS transporter, partial [Klebsiella pneumoniae]